MTELTGDGLLRRVNNNNLKKLSPQTTTWQYSILTIAVLFAILPADN